MTNFPAPGAKPHEAPPAPTVGRRLPRPERVITIVGLATAIYYVAAFAYELGFFWEIGPVYMSAFSMGDHITHAATLVLATIGAGLLAPGLYMTIYSVHQGEAPGAGWPLPPADEAATDSKSAWPRRAWTSFGFLIVAIYFYHVLAGELRTGSGPARVWLGSVGIIAFLAIGLFNRPEKEQAKRLPFLLLALGVLVGLSPSAAGHWAYKKALESDTRVVMKIGERIMNVTPVFVGSSRLIVATEHGIYLLSDDGTLQIRIGRRPREA